MIFCPSRSPVLLRTPAYEFILDVNEPGGKVSNGPFSGDEDDMLKEIEFGDQRGKIITDHHQFDLDLRKVDGEDIEQAKAFLKRTNFDNRFETRIAK